MSPQNITNTTKNKSLSKGRVATEVFCTPPESGVLGGCDWPSMWRISREGTRLGKRHSNPVPYGMLLGLQVKHTFVRRLFCDTAPTVGDMYIYPK